MTKFAITSGSLDDEIRTAAGLARKLGFGGIVVPSRTPTADLVELGETGSREYRHILASFDLHLVAIDSSLGKEGFSPKADIDRALARLTKVLTAAVALGRTMVCLDLGPLPAAPVTVTPKPKVTPEQAGLILIPELIPEASSPAPSDATPRDLAFESSVDSALRELGRHADRLGTIIAMRTSLASYASLEFAMARVGCPWFGVDLDTVHMLADDWPADEAFSRLGSLVRHVRARDAAKGAGGRVLPCPIGAGNVDWKQLFNNLEAADYTGFVTVDTAELQDRVGSAEDASLTLSRYTGRGPG